MIAQADVTDNTDMWFYDVIGDFNLTDVVLRNPYVDYDNDDIFADEPLEADDNSDLLDIAADDIAGECCEFADAEAYDYYLNDGDKADGMSKGDSTEDSSSSSSADTQASIRTILPPGFQRRQAADHSDGGNGCMN